LLKHLSVSADEGDDGLFEMMPVEPPVVKLGPVDKIFRPFRPDQMLLVPPSLDEWLPQNHLARFIADLVDGHLDLSAFYADYTEGRGAPPSAATSLETGSWASKHLAWRGSASDLANGEPLAPSGG